MANHYIVNVGNVGNAWAGTNGAEALRQYGQWKAASIADHGRASGEPVVLLRNGEPWHEFNGPKLSFDALEALANERRIDADDIDPRALQRMVWVAEWHIPGCLSESFSVCRTKADALETALGMCGHARGARADLIRYGRTDRVSSDAYVSMAVTTIERRALHTLF